MADPTPRTPEPEETPQIADAGAFFQDEAEAIDDSRPPSPAVEIDGGYDVLGGEPAAELIGDTPAHPVPPRAADTPNARLETAPPAQGDEVWTRWAEWRPTLLILALVAAVTLVLAYLTFDLENLMLPLGILLAGGLLGLFLSYPIVITLERPVRMTPEQALKDFYGSLAHHFPHYRRMWLLLSSQGRSSGEFGSFEGFKSYWRRRQSELRGGKISEWTPLVFVIDDFQAPRSKGETQLDARYTVNVFARGRRGEGPRASILCDTSLVRGPDGMWYLNQGTLPRPGA